MVTERLGPQESDLETIAMTGYYDQEGDKTYHWTLGRKPGTKHVDDTLRILKVRFVKGEISEEEYNRMKAVIE